MAFGRDPVDMVARAVRVVFALLALVAAGFAATDDWPPSSPPIEANMDCAIGTPAVSAELVDRNGSELSFRVTGTGDHGARGAAPSTCAVRLPFDLTVGEVIIVRFDSDDAVRFRLGDDYLLPIEELTAGGRAAGDAFFGSKIDDGFCGFGARTASGDEIHGPWYPTWWMLAVASVMVALAVTVWTRIPRTGGR